MIISQYKEKEELCFDKFIDIIFGNQLQNRVSSIVITTMKDKIQAIEKSKDFLNDLSIKGRPLNNYLDYILKSELTELEFDTYGNEIKKEITKNKVLNRLKGSKHSTKELLNIFFMRDFQPYFKEYLCHYIFLHSEIDLKEKESLKDIFLEINRNDLLKDFDYEFIIQELLKQIEIPETRAKDEINLYIKNLKYNKVLTGNLKEELNKYYESTGELILIEKNYIPKITVNTNSLLEEILTVASKKLEDKRRTPKQRESFELRYQSCVNSPLYKDSEYLENVLFNIFRCIDSALKMKRYYEEKELLDKIKNLLLISFEIELQDYDTTTGIDGVFVEDLLRFSPCIEDCLFNGIRWTMKYTYTTKEIQENLTKLIPKNPKDEYPMARNMKRQFFIHVGPTNSGKTYESLEKLMYSENGLYLGPLRLLALEVQQKFLDRNIPCNLLTGEEEDLVEFATHTASTIEKANLEEEYEVCVIDECQMISEEKQRGAFWTRAILGLRSKEIHICTAPEALNLIVKIIESCEESTYKIIKHKRKSKLTVDTKPFKIPDMVQTGDAIVAFSKKRVLNLASFLTSAGFKVSIIYGAMPPDSRKKQVQLFNNGETNVLVSTNAIGMGLNLKRINRIIFFETTYFNGEKRTNLTKSLVKQVGGRAGRGFDKNGIVMSVTDSNFIKKQMEEETEELEIAYLGFSDTILNISYPLDTILKVWKNTEVKEPYQKMNIDRYLTLFDYLPYANKLEKSDLMKMLSIPFEEKNEELLSLWKHYCDSIYHDGEIYWYEENSEEKSLNNLETYYKKLDLYYSFSKAFSLPIPLDWLKKEKEETANMINEILIEDIVNEGAKVCKICGRKLSPLSAYDVCEKCFRKSKRW